ncbi:hypothetical protein PS880_04349 [Pseudomonas fluorescens]|uniref:Uncharacterized protein n=1 Tax=Pseudomonas fluorescens TaxID=294 RepID=A0A5E7N4D8_PSEFL|nr:hypothetical protein PS880_04349 [Pseudomonas fluorescens]
MMVQNLAWVYKPGVGSGWGRNDTLSNFRLRPQVFASQQYMGPAQW